MPASTLPTKSAPTSAALVKMPPPSRAKMEMRLAPKASATRLSITSRSSGAWPAGPVRYQKKVLIASKARPATSMPVIAPARKATVRPLCSVPRDASAVRTLARTEMFMPMKPAAPDRIAPIKNPTAEVIPRKRKTRTATTMPTTAMVVY